MNVIVNLYNQLVVVYYSACTCVRNKESHSVFSVWLSLICNQLISCYKSLTLSIIY